MENGIEKAGLLSHRPLEYVATTDYSEAIERLSPVFCETYAQSLRAEENGLTQICGTGYRRALEYLVKDFALLKTEPTDDARRKVMKMLLAHCIREYLPEQIQEAAKRAAWLGNDETHYYRSWSGQDVNNLKSLITLTAKAIDFTLELEKYVQTMPEGKK